MTLPRAVVVTAAVMSLTSMMVMTGCSRSTPRDGSTMSTSESSTSGETLAAARERIARSSSLTETSVKVNKTVSGLTTNRRIWFEATSSATDQNELAQQVKYLLQLGWSINDVDANEGISVRLHTSPQVVVGELLDSTWTDLEFRSSPDTFKSLVVVPRSTLTAKLGPWPGDTPTSG